MLNQLDHIAFRTDDLDALVTHYTQNLSYEVIQEMTLQFGESRALSRVLQLPGHPFYVFVDMGMTPDNIISQWVAAHGSGLHHLAYLVDDIDAAHDALKKRGVEFTTGHVIDTGGGLRQLFTQPDPVTGLITELIQRDRPDVFFVQKNVEALIRSTQGLE